MDLLLVCEAQQQELNKYNSKLKQVLRTKHSGYVLNDLEGVELVFYKDKIYISQASRKHPIIWYHAYLCHPGADRLYNTLKQVCYWKGMTSTTAAHCKRCNKCQKHKKRLCKYGHLPSKVIGDLIPWHTVHTDLIGPYALTVKQYQPDGTIITKEFSLTCMTFLDPVTGWFEIVQVPLFNIDDVKNGNREVIDKTSARISQLLNQVWLSRYPRPKEVVFNNGSEFKKDFLPLLMTLR